MVRRIAIAVVAGCLSAGLLAAPAQAAGSSRAPLDHPTAADNRPPVHDPSTALLWCYDPYYGWYLCLWGSSSL